jgi:membrane associated rhomboid family serine protease
VISATVTFSMIAVNVLVYLLYNARTGLPPDFMIYYPAGGQSFPQVLTYMFVHAGISHILFNMIVILSFGVVIEKVYGPWRYLCIYVVSGVAAALSQTLLVHDAALLGASGAATAILAVFVRHFPRARVLFFSVLPLPAWVALIVIIAINVYGGLTGGVEGSILLERNVGYIPHLAGLATGLLLSVLMIPPGKGRRWVIRSRLP